MKTKNFIFIYLFEIINQYTSLMQVFSWQISCWTSKLRFAKRDL